MRTVDEIIEQLAVVTDEQRSLAWSPMPPFTPAGPLDCRLGCGIDFNFETPRARWIQARRRWQRSTT